MPPQPNPRAAWPSSDDNTAFYLLVIVIGCAALSYMLWLNYHGTISAAVMALRHTEIGLLRHFTDRYDLADRQMAAADPNTVTLAALWAISGAIGRFVRLPAALFIALLAVLCMLRAAPSRFRRGFDLDGLAREQARSFPITAAYSARHLRLVPPLATGPRPADYALNPDEWVALHASSPDRGFDGRAARRALVDQLGPRWRGPSQASPQVRFFLAVFALHLAERRTEAQQLLGIASAGLSIGKDDHAGEGPTAALSLPVAAITAADNIISDVEFMTPAIKIATRHAYAHTALMGLLSAARLRAGVLAPGQFAWLKLVDRPLWYALHSLGFETEGVGRYLHPNPAVEALGARDHWAVEQMAGEPVVEPSLDRALAALRRAVSPPETDDRR